MRTFFIFHLHQGKARDKSPANVMPQANWPIPDAKVRPGAYHTGQSNMATTWQQNVIKMKFFHLLSHQYMYEG